jgi:hypothetical protein
MALAPMTTGTTTISSVAKLPMRNFQIARRISEVSGTNCGMSIVSAALASGSAGGSGLRLFFARLPDVGADAGLRGDDGAAEADCREAGSVED